MVKSILHRFPFFIFRKNNTIRQLFMLLPVALLSGCNSTKYISDGQYLLDKNVIIRNNNDINIKDFESYYRQKPNKRIIGLRFHLWLYNSAKPGSSRWLSRNLRKIGEEPVLFDSMLMRKTVEQFKQFLRNKGYYESVVKDSVVLKNKKARVFYKINPNVPYKIRRIGYKLDSTGVKDAVLQDTLGSILKTGRPFDMDLFQDERARIEANLKNKGYYNFAKEYIYFEADSAVGNHKVDITLGVKPFILQKTSDTLVTSEHRKYKIHSVKVVLDRDVALDDEESKGFTEWNYDSIHFSSVGKLKPVVHTSTLANSVYIRPGQPYHLQTVDETYRHLSSLRVFKFVNIGFKDLNTKDSIGSLDATIRLYPMVMQSYQIEAEGTNSSGDLGSDITFSYQHKNLFRGAETFDLKLKGAFEAMKQKSDAGFYNTLELSANANISFPKFLLPFKSLSFVQKYNPKTNLSIGYSYLRRPKFVMTNVNASFGYVWHKNEHTSFTVNPLEVSYVKLPYISADFQKAIDTTHLKYSFYNHLLTVSSFTYTYSSQNLNKNSPFFFLKYSIESAGSILRLLTNVVGKDTASLRRKILGNVFYQFVRTDIDFRYYYPLNQTDKLVYRIFMGVGVPFVNSNELPFEKMYYAGGSTDIRAWSMWSLGPGSYKHSGSLSDYALSADMKLTANVEYRFKLFFSLEGAFFVDAGNIWDIRKRTEHPDGDFQINQFYKQIAVGSGFGLRSDLKFVLLRLDLGIKLRDPQYNSGERWIPGNHRITWKDDMNLTFGIGYPF
jgi:hypothetical protein